MRKQQKKLPGSGSTERPLLSYSTQFGTSPLQLISRHCGSGVAQGLAQKQIRRTATAFDKRIVEFFFPFLPPPREQLSSLCHSTADPCALGPASKQRDVRHSQSGHSAGGPDSRARAVLPSRKHGMDRFS
uniref:Uncharacterized protein n=1 Tax=Knipowitschia caucasica TaxID=637954 RepID=A0AAV2MB51_KNICA